ncbi:MAG: anti-sigma factor [Solirubrobacterales bacterium]
MSERRDCDALRDDLAAYALGALGDETAALERHLETCESCQARLRWLTPAIDLLPAAVEQVTPPPRLRENLMAAVRAEAADAAPAAPPAAASRESWWSAFRNLAMRPATGMAVLILLVAAVGAGYLLRGESTVEPSVVKAEAMNGAVPVSATLERAGDDATLRVNQLPAIDDDQVYEVWVQRAGVMEPRGTFVLESDGSAVAAVEGPLDDGEAVLVTREPRGGSAQPTTEPVLSAPL